MVSTKLCGGLANQLFQIAAACALALRNGDFCLLDFNQCSTTHQGFPSSKYQYTLFKHLQGVGLDLDKQADIYQEPNFTYDEIPYRQGIILSGYFQSEKYFADYKQKIRNLFYFDPETIAKTHHFLAAIQGHRPVVIVNVRRGDYVTTFPHVYYLCEVEYYKQAMALFLDHNFVFVSDDMEWCLENFKGDNIFFSPFHDLDDMTLMAKNNVAGHILANSTFGWWGAWLNENENKKVVAPAKWFKPEAGLDSKDLYCDGWIVI